MEPLASLNGLRPLLPVFDHLLTTLVSDLEQRGLLDDVLVIAMGEFGRTPRIGTQGSADGRNHWPFVMSMTLAGGGFRHGQVIGATERDGGQIKERPVTPGDIAATNASSSKAPPAMPETPSRAASDATTAGISLDRRRLRWSAIPPVIE